MAPDGADHPPMGRIDEGDRVRPVERETRHPPGAGPTCGPVAGSHDPDMALQADETEPHRPRRRWTS
jgi:hypothetical protein